MFTIWRACKNLNVRPPGVKEKWEDNTPVMQAYILGFYQRCEYVDSQNQGAMAAALMGAK